MKLGFSQQEIIATAKSLGLPSDGFIQRRVARAFDLVESKKVSQIDDGIFRVRSQYDEGKSYIVNVNSGAPSCDCPDGERTINCKHRIASLLYARRQAQAITIVKTTDGNEGDYWRRCWLIAQGNIRTVVYEEHNGRLFCNCGANLKDCKHKQLVIKTVTKELKQKRIVNECGSTEVQALQSKLNAQMDSLTGVSKTQMTIGNNGNGAYCAPSLTGGFSTQITTPQLDINDPFQECEQLDIDQIEGRLNGELVHKLSNGEYVISYQGIMTLSEKHHIEFSSAIHDDTHTVIAKGRCRTSERVSGKPINGNEVTAMELAKRNAARQLLPLAEIKATECKAKLESEFDWQKAYAKCVELLSSALKDTPVVGTKAILDCIIHDLVNWGKLRQDNPSHYNRTEWLLIHEYCQKEASVERDPGSTNNWSYNSAVFIDRCKEAIAKVRDEKKSIEANEQPLQNDNGDKRKLMMDKKLRTWLVESDGTKKAISCREICEQFESKQNPSIVTRLRAGIDDGADISIVELDN